jgi:hypothetical protein
MAIDAVPAPASSESMIQTWWFGFLVRTGLVLLAFWALWFAQDRYGAFRVRLIRPFSGFDSSLWLVSVVATVVAGLLFGLAAWVPFTRIRYLSSRLLLAALALVPVAHFWWIFFNYHGSPTGWLGRAYWFDMSAETQFVLAGFAGVALASGLRAKDQALGLLEP